MSRKTLNLGIVAHVDAGKTTLTERLLYAAGVIDAVGSVDAGTTQTDSLALERQRGITIRAAVVSFEIAGVAVNLIDTPGHPDFIAEVERVLSLLDGAVLVISAVEGVQPQTRVLLRALRRLRVPTLLFVNKIDRLGADPAGVLDTIRTRLDLPTVALGTVDRPGSRAARVEPREVDDPALQRELLELLADRDEVLLATYVEDEPAVTGRVLRRALAAQTRRCLVHPAFLGSAVTGEGVEALRAGLVELLPAEIGDTAAAVSGRVFKIDRGPAGEKVAYVRMFAGTVHLRERLPIVAGTGGPVLATTKPTAISVCDQGSWVSRQQLRAGEIGRLWGLAPARIGDTIGQPSTTALERHFPPPTMETVVTAVDPRSGGALRSALAQLAEQDPLINVRVDESDRAVCLSLYGEVQKEVIQATLATEFGIEVTFRETTIICVERPSGVGEAVEYLNTEDNPFQATIGLRVEPRPPGCGLDFQARVEPQAMPLYVYRNADTFSEHMARYVRRTLREGRFGWGVTDCLVTLVECGYSVADGPPSRRGPTSTPADFRQLTPLVLMAALERARTVVCEPILRVSLEAPVRSADAVLTSLGRIGAAVRDQSVQGELTRIETVVPAARLAVLQRQLPALTAGEGGLESTFDGYRPVTGEPPVRPRTMVDPRQRDRYLLSLTRQGARG